MRIILLTLLLLYSVRSNAGITPETLEGIETVDGQYMLAAIYRGVIVIDATRTDDEFTILMKKNGASTQAIDENLKARKVIPTAQHCFTGEHRKSDNQSIARALLLLEECGYSKENFPTDTEIVTYCVHRSCWLSVNAALALKELGFTNIKWYRNGITDWNYNYANKVDSSKVVVLNRDEIIKSHRQIARQQKAEEKTRTVRTENIQQIVSSETSLPSNIRKDKYMVALTNHLKKQEYHEALVYFDTLDSMNVELSSSFTYFWGETLIKTGDNQEGLAKLYHYLERAGSGGKHYSSALQYINEAEGR